MKGYTKWAWIATVVYLGVCFWCAAHWLGWKKWLGDGLGRDQESLYYFSQVVCGFLSPVGLIWVALTFIRQSKELDDSSAALESQEKAYSALIKEQAELVKATRENTAALKQALADERRRSMISNRPFFKVTDTGKSNDRNVHLTVEVEDNDAFGVRVSVPDCKAEMRGPSRVMPVKTRFSIQLYRVESDLPTRITFCILCQDRVGNEVWQNVHLGRLFPNMVTVEGFDYE